MAQSGYTPLSLYYSSTSGVAPTSGNLVSGELAINITDGKLYFKNTSGAVTLLASAAGAVAATNLSGGTSGQIPYQNGASSTTFMAAPGTSGTYLGWNGSGFYWSSTTGLSGYSGFSGYSGGTGTNGASGYSGISGYSGSGISGYSGYSGATGTGTSGYSGFSGYSGYSSFSGFSGYSGYSGVSGYSGLGLSGYSGISGYSGAASSSTANSVTFNSSGSGASSPTSFNGSVAQTISYNTIGAPGISGTNATGTWPIGISGTAATATNQSGGTVSATSIVYSTTLTGGTGIVNLGSGQFYKDTSGNVSIGSTATPATLYVKGGNSNNLSVDNGGQQFTTLSLYNNGTEKAQMYWDQTNTLFVFGTDAGAPVVFKAATVERMRISTAGGVSIGTSTDAGVGNLLVNGTVKTTSITFSDATVQTTAAIRNRGGATTTSSASDITLTSSSNQIQNITMTTTGLYVVLPDATTCTAGSTYFQIYSNGDIPFGIKDSAGNILGYTLTPYQVSICSLTANATAAGIWAINQDTSNLVQSQVTASGVSAETVLNNVIQSCLLTATSFIIVYRIGLAVKAIGGTISGNTITFGTAITITGTTSDNPQSMSIAKTSSTTCVAAWNAGNSNFKAVSLSLSGTTVSAGTPTTVTSSDTSAIDNSNCYVFSLNNTTAIFVYTATYSSGTTSAVRAGTSSGTTLTLGTAVTWSNSNNLPATAPVTSTQIVTAGYINNTGQYTTKIATVSGTTISYGAAFIGTNGGDTGGYNSTSWYMPSAYLTATTALFGNKLVTWSGTTISSIVILPNTCIGSPDSTISGYNYSTDSGATVTKQFNTSASAIAGKVATPYGAGAYKLTGDATNYVGTAINIPTSGGSTGYVGFSLIKVA